MKGIRYRIQFRIEDSGEKSENRDSKIDAIFSSISNIDSSEKVECPSIGSIIELDGVDYEIVSKKYSFLNEGDLVIFITIAGIMKASTKEEMESKKRKEESDILYEKMKSMIRYK